MYSEIRDGLSHSRSHGEKLKVRFDTGHELWITEIALPGHEKVGGVGVLMYVGHVEKFQC